MLKTFGTAIAAAVLAVTPLSAACWTNDEASAASIRELQSMLMVATLRCQVAHHDMTSEYNDFLRANKSLIQKGNERIKAHFVKMSGPAAGQKAYDSFATHLANGFGADGSSAEACAKMVALAREATLVAGNQDGLLLLAEQHGIEADTVGGRCTPARATVAMTATAAMASSAMAGRDR